MATTLFGSQNLFVEVETLIELIDTSSGVNQLLLTSEERMALRADFHADVLSCRGCFNYLSAVAFNCCGLIIGMYSGFHQNHLHTRLEIYLLLDTYIHNIDILSQMFRKSKSFFQKSLILTLLEGIIILSEYILLDFTEVEYGY